jgi:hypothetical protein
LINPAMYKLSAEHAPGISDVTTGNNSVSFVNGKAVVSVPGYAAKPGYDLASGVGTVDAARFVPELARTATNRPPDHDRCWADSDHGALQGGTTAYDFNQDCCPANKGNDRGQQCCPDPDGNYYQAGFATPNGGGNGDGQDPCTDASGGGWPAPVAPGQGSPTGQPHPPVSPGSPCPGGSTTPQRSPTGAATLPATTTATQPAATASGATTSATAGQVPAPATASLVSARPASANPAGATPATGQPSTSTSTSYTHGSGGVAAQANQSLVVPSGVILGSPATVSQLLRK